MTAPLSRMAAATVTPVAMPLIDALAFRKSRRVVVMNQPSAAISVRRFGSQVQRGLDEGGQAIRQGGEGIIHLNERLFRGLETVGEVPAHGRDDVARGPITGGGADYAPQRATCAIDRDTHVGGPPGGARSGSFG